jgi:hypothetical protein
MVIVIFHTAMMGFKRTMMLNYFDIGKGLVTGGLYYSAFMAVDDIIYG